ncbi:MAG: SOS response-associated peptidase [Chloroflexota bacterium]|nr:SOS response-associated peptidase [Chloroflexota bacterium]
MCGRFTLVTDAETLQKALELGEVPELEPRFNIAPTQDVAVVTDPKSRNVEMFRWGLVPGWAKDLSIGNRLINARAETVAEKPAFRSAFGRRRCLVLADGFYEWRKPKDKKGSSQPFYFRLESGEPFAFAGLWEVWRKGEEDELFTCTIITGPANERVEPIHSRQPIIIPPTSLWQWLDPEASTEALQSLLVPIDADELVGYPVSALVNDPSHEMPELIESVAI